jgi:hypothetical protein
MFLKDMIPRARPELDCPSIGVVSFRDWRDPCHGWGGDGSNSYETGAFGDNKATTKLT